MGIKPIDNLFKGATKAVSGIIGGGGGDSPKPTPTAGSGTSQATQDEAANQGRLNPLILTGARGATDEYTVGKKLLLGA